MVISKGILHLVRWSVRVGTFAWEVSTQAVNANTSQSPDASVWNRWAVRVSRLASESEDRTVGLWTREIVSIFYSSQDFCKVLAWAIHRDRQRTEIPQTPLSNSFVVLIHCLLLLFFDLWMPTQLCVRLYNEVLVRQSAAPAPLLFTFVLL